MPKAESSRSERYRNLGDSIDELGIPAMAPCPQCIRSGSTCIVRRGYKKCGACTRKNMSCGGNFSRAEFDRASKTKAKLQEQSRQGQELMLALAEELVKTQKRVADAERRIAFLVKRQKDMADREARALGELEGSDDAADLAMLDDNPFLWEDPMFDAVMFSDPSEPLPEVAKSPRQASGSGDTSG